MCAGLLTKIFGGIDDPRLRRTPTFQVVATSPEEEDEFDFVRSRNVPKPCSLFDSVMNLVKGSLGGGIVSGHVAYMKAGIFAALPLNIILGIYMTYCIYILIWSTQKLCRRTKVAAMSYPDVGEAAFSCFNSIIVQRLALSFRYYIDATIILNLFGACAAYQIIIAKSVKQLVENVQSTTIEARGPYPHIRLYLAVFLLPLVCICLIMHWKWLTPFSTIANILIVLLVGITIHYAFLYNPEFKNMVKIKNFQGVFEFLGVIVFGMSNAGIVLPVENNMRNPSRFNIAFFISMMITTVLTIMESFFGYMAFLEKSEVPLTHSLPMTVIPKIFKGAVAVMIYVTHAVNFWVPFNLCWHYLKQNHKSRFTMWELIYRAIIVTLIVLVATIFPNIETFMGFLGTFCLSNMAFIWPNLIYLMVIWERPGLGKCHWRLWTSAFLIFIGLIILIAGTVVSVADLIKVLQEINVGRRKRPLYSHIQNIHYEHNHEKVNLFL